MNIAVIGANGRAGKLITEEALRRGHEVTAILRDEQKGASKGAKIFVKDLFELSYEDIRSYDVLIDAFAVWKEEELLLHQTSLKHLSDVLSGKSNRLLVVGGAGSLYIDAEHKTRLMDTPEFPASFKPLASNMGAALDALKKRNDVNWTYLSPSTDFVADRLRSGTYRAGGEELLVNSDGDSVIGYADYAIAMIDEAEQGKHIRQRFTVVEA